MFSSLSSFSFFRRDPRLRCARSPLTSIMTYAASGRKIDKAIVRIVDDEDNLTISLNIADRQRNLNRPRNEALGRSLHRLRLRKAKKNETTNEIEEIQIDNVRVALYESRSETLVVDESLPNETAWRNGSWLVVGDVRYEVLTNPPTVLKLVLNEIPIVDHPIFPLCELQFVNEEQCRWEWLRKGHKNGKWERLEYHERVYTPVNEDTGCFLGVKCTPTCQQLTERSDQLERLGAPVIAEIGPVSPARLEHSGRYRHELTTTSLNFPSFRVVTYNVLADSYVSRPNYEGIAHCSLQDRDIDVRKQLVLKELLGYNADIICLQECDATVFETYYQHHMRINGFQPFFAQKSGTTKEGEALFVREAKFRVVDHQRIHMNQILDPELPAYLQPFEKMISTSKNMKKALRSLVTIAQIAVLEPKGFEANPLCVINTHLISNGYSEHIRTLHMLTMLHKAKEIAASHEVDAQIVFMGDLNSSLDCETGLVDAGVTLLRDGYIDPDHWEWEECRKFSWNKFTPEDDVVMLQKSANEEDRDPIQGIYLKIPVELRSAVDLCTPYSNYTEGFKGLLDYIWYEPRCFELLRSIPIPTPKQLGGCCPSAVYPSDHLAVVAELKYKETSIDRNLSSAGILTASLENIPAGVERLRAGEVLGVPTDTIYGLAADASNADAVNSIYSIKGRLLDAPLAICVAGAENIEAYGDVQHLPAGLLNSLLPGPITIVVERKDESPLARELNRGIPLIGIRVPNNAFILNLCAAFGAPIALTSANLSRQKSSLCVDDFRHLWDKCGVVYDGGPASSSYLGSTVVDLSVAGRFRLLRSGDMCEAIIETLYNFGLKEQERNSC